MKGVIQSFSAELDQGIIFGDDKNKYNFSSSNWKDAKKSPRSGLRVVFETEDEKAVEIHLAKSYAEIYSSIGYPILFFGVVSVLYSFPNLKGCGCMPHPDAEAKNMTGVINRAQKVYRLEKQQFSHSIEDLEVKFNPEFFEDYNIAISEADKQKVITIITTNKEDSRSFAGAVSYSESDSDRGFEFIDIVCQSIEPSKEIAAPIYKDNAFKCGAGSEEISLFCHSPRIKIRRNKIIIG